MTIRPLSKPIVFAVLFTVAAVAQAQTAPPTTDVGPPPAEERTSTGAVVLEKSPAPTLRDKVVTDAAIVGAASSIAATSQVRTQPTRASTRSAKARARAAQADLRRSGAGSPTGR